VFSKPIRKLSTNVLREVCAYLQDLLYPCISKSKLTLWNLVTGQAATTTLSRSFNSGTVYCLYQPNAVLCVGDDSANSRVFSMSLPSGALTPFPSMEVERAWAGIIAWKSHVYVFGGYNDMSCEEAEKFHIPSRQWIRLPRMSTSRLAFTPLLYKGLFLLISSAPGAQPVETFSPLSETYETLNVCISGVGNNGTVSFIKEDEVWVVCYGGSLIRWKPTDPSYRLSKISLPDNESGVSAALPVTVGGTVYWTHYHKGCLVRFDFETLAVAQMFSS